MPRYSEWFEKNQTKTVIIYTFTIIGITWGFSSFILNDNKITLKNTQIESAKQELEQYKTKVEILQDENDKLRNENKKYFDWLISSTNSIPFYENKIKNLEFEIEEIKREKPVQVENNNGAIEKKNYHNQQTISSGETFIDEKTQVSLSISKVILDPLSINGMLNLPTQNIQLKGTISGTKWDFEFKGIRYMIIIEKIVWFSDSCTVRIEEKKDA